MSIINIEHYTQSDGMRTIKVFLSPTKKFPEGKNFFYTNESFISFVNAYDWRLANRFGFVYVVTKVDGKEYYFHEMVFAEIYKRELCNGFYVTHRNAVGYDNVFENLFVNTPYHCNYSNGFQKLYHYDASSRLWIPDIPAVVSNVVIQNSLREDDVLMTVSDYERLLATSNACNNFFNILNYRRGDKSERVLDAERKGEITREMAVLVNASQYVENAWYFLRFPHLYDYLCVINGTSIPKYELNSIGQMIDVKTKQPLCPI